jgi:hypothetical protein
LIESKKACGSPHRHTPVNHHKWKNQKTKKNIKTIKQYKTIQNNKSKTISIKYI